MPSNILKAYRQALSDQGLTDPRDDYFLVQDIGPIVQQEAPHLFEQDPELGKLWSDVRDANAPSLSGEFGRSLKSGSQGLASVALGGAALLADSKLLRRKALSFSEDAGGNAPTIPTLEDIRPGQTTAKKVFSRDALRYAISKFGLAAPSIAESALTAAAGAAVGTAVAPGPGTIAGGVTGLVQKGLVRAAIRSLLKKGVAKELVEEATEEGIERALLAGTKQVIDNVAVEAAAIGGLRSGVATNVVNSYILNAGDVASEGGDRSTALMLGAVSALPDTILPAYVLKKFFRGVARPAAVEAGKKMIGTNARRLLEAAGVPAVEFGQEYFQEAINIVARNLKDEVDPLTFTDADKIRLREAGITGAAGGGLAAPIVLATGRPAVTPPVAPEPIPVDPAAPPAPPTEPLAPVEPVEPVAEARTNAQIIQEIMALTPEQHLARLEELSSKARTPEEEPEYQLLLAQAPAAPAVGEIPTVSEEEIVPVATDEPAVDLTAEAALPVEPAAPDLVEPVSPAAVQAVETESEFDRFVNEGMQRHIDEGMGQVVLDDMEESGRTPNDTITDFWNNTYANLPPKRQRRFERMIKGAASFEPGDVIGLDAEENEVVANTWQDILPDLSSDVESLEGTERGMIALMETANRIVASQQTPVAPVAELPEPAIAPLVAEPEPIVPFETGAVIEGAPSIDFRASPQFAQADATQWAQVLGENLSGSTRSNKKGNRSLTRVGVVLQAPDGRVVISGLTLPQKALTSTGSTVFKEPVLQRMGITKQKARSIEAGGNHPATVTDVVDAGYRPLAVIHFSGDPTKIYQTFPSQAAFDSSWGATEKTQGAKVRPPVLAAQPAISRNREADIYRELDALGNAHLKARDEVERREIKAEIDAAYARLDQVIGTDQLQSGDTSLEENNLRRSQQQTVLESTHTSEFQAVIANLRNRGMKIDVFAKEFFAQSARETIEQQIQALEAQLPTVQGPQRAVILKGIAQRQLRLSELDQAVGIAYSPWHVGISLEDVNNANTGNLVTLLHEAAESLTMRMNPVMKGQVLRAVDSTMEEMRAKAAASSEETGVDVATTVDAADLLAETLAQKLAANGVNGSTNLAQSIIRWVKDLYYRTVMAVQKGFGKEPSMDTAINWFENQMRREVGGDYDYRFAGIVDRLMVQPLAEQVRKFTGARGTPGGISDFFDPLTEQMEQPSVDPTSTEALAWNVRYRQVESDQNIPDPEARARIDMAAVNEVLDHATKIKSEVALDMDWAAFWKLVGRGEDPNILLADSERRMPGSSSAQIGGERMTDPMNELASLGARSLIKKIHLRQLRELAKANRQIKDSADTMVDEATELNRVEADYRNSGLHEDTLRAKLQKMARSMIRSMERGLGAAHTSGRLAEAIRSAEGLIEGDAIPERYQRILKAAAEGTIPVFDSIRALAELDLPLSEMTNAEVVRAIADSAQTNPQLQNLAANKPLAVAIAELARANTEQVDQIQLGWLRDTTRFREINQELEGIRQARGEDLKSLIRGIDERVSAKGLSERIKTGYLKRRRTLQTMQSRIQTAEERTGLLDKVIPLTAARAGELQQAGSGSFSEWFPEDGAEFTAMIRNTDGSWRPVKRTLSFNADGSATNSDQIRSDLTSNKEWLLENPDKAGTQSFQEVKRQTFELMTHDLQRKYPAGHAFLIDKMIGSLTTEAKNAGHSSGARAAQMVHKFDLIHRNHRDEVGAAAGWWSRAFKDVAKSSGIKDHGQLLSQVYNPVMYFLNVNPGLDETHAIRQATRMARELIPGELGSDFNTKFENLLKRTKDASDLMIKIAEKYEVFVKDPRLHGELRKAVAQGWLTTMRHFKPAVVQTIVQDMVENAGWLLNFKEAKGPDGQPRQSVVRATTFDNFSAEEDLAPVNSEVIRPILAQYFTPSIVEHWLTPFVNKPGKEIFSWNGDPIPQLAVQQAWEKSGGDPLQFIDNLAEGQQLVLDEETGADPLATFRKSILTQIDGLFSMEAKMAYDSQQVRDMFNPMGSKPHALMDARLNDLLPPEHLEFQAFDPTSAQRLLGLIGYHAAYGRNGERMIRTVNELKGVLGGRKAEFDQLSGTTEGARAAEASSRGLDYKEIKSAAARYDGVNTLQSKLAALMGINNPEGAFRDLRGGMEIISAAAGQQVDQPKVGAYNLLSVAQRPYAMNSLGPMTIGATVRGYGNLLQLGTGSFLENLNIHLMKASEYAKEIGSVEGQAIRNLPYGVVTADIGNRGRFQTSRTDRWLIRPLRYLRALQRKGVRLGIGEGARDFARLALIPGLGVLNTISQLAAQANTLAQIQLLEQIIKKGIKYFAANPTDLHDPSFRFTDKNIKIGRFNKGVFDYFRNKTVEYGMGNIEDLVKHGAEQSAKGKRLLTKSSVLKLAQMTAETLDGAAAIATTPSVLHNNKLLKAGMPLLRWPLWMMNMVHQGLNNAEGQKTLKSVAKGVGTLALWNLPIGIAFSLLMDQYDDKVLGKKSNKRAIDPVNAIPLVGPALGLARGQQNPWDQAMGLLQRSAQGGNVYGLGADLVSQVIGGIDKGSGQREFSLDQRVLVMSQLLTFMKSVRNLISQGGDATWASVWRPALQSIGGNGALHSLDITNNLLGLDNQESRLIHRINASNWLRSAGREAGLEVRMFGGGSSAPTPMSVWTREMQLAAMANDRLGFLDGYRRALNAAREAVGKDPRVTASDREKEAAKRVLSSWKSRNPLQVFRYAPTSSQLANMYSIMDEGGRNDVQEAIQRFEKFSSLITPSSADRYFSRRASSINRKPSLRIRGASFLQGAGR